MLVEVYVMIDKFFLDKKNKIKKEQIILLTSFNVFLQCIFYEFVYLNITLK